VPRSEPGWVSPFSHCDATRRMPVTIGVGRSTLTPTDAPTNQRARKAGR
jgi:hypothetical protein